jgi:hypothetical protein
MMLLKAADHPIRRFLDTNQISGSFFEYGYLEWDLLIGATMSPAITAFHVERKPELTGHRICSEHCIGIGFANEQRPKRTEEL